MGVLVRMGHGGLERVSRRKGLEKRLEQDNEEVGLGKNTKVL